MLVLHITYLLLIAVQSSNVLIPSQNFDEIKFDWKFDVENEKNTLAVFNTKNSYIADIIKTLPKKFPIQILSNTSKKFEYTKFEYALIFLENIDDIVNISKEFLMLDLVAFSDPKYFYIVLNSSSNISEDSIKLNGNRLWNKHRIIDYVILQNKTTIFSYNPFTGKVSTLTSISKNLFPYKLNNMNGNKIKGTLIAPGMTPNENNEANVCTSGPLCRIYEVFIQRLNASFQPISMDPDLIYRYSKRAVIDEIIDISIGTHWLKENHLMYSSCSVAEITVVGLVPKAKLYPMLNRMFFIFDNYIWTLIVILKISFGILKHLGLVAKSRSNTSWSMMMVSNYIFSIIIESAFQSGIINALTSPQYEPDIDSIDDLLKSGLPFYGEDDWKFLISPKIKLIHMSYLKQGVEIFALKPNQAYLSTNDYAQLVLTSRTNYSTFYSKYYHVMKKPLGLGKITYYIRKNSPFRKVFNQVLMELNQAGFHMPFGIRWYSIKNERILTKLKLEHLNGAFLPWICGLVLSILVFLIELYYKRLKK